MLFEQVLPIELERAVVEAELRHVEGQHVLLTRRGGAVEL